MWLQLSLKPRTKRTDAILYRLKHEKPVSETHLLYKFMTNPSPEECYTILSFNSHGSPDGIYRRQKNSEACRDHTRKNGIDERWHLFRQRVALQQTPRDCKRARISALAAVSPKRDTGPRISAGTEPR